MERFDIRTDDRCGWELKKRDDGLGMFCWADEALNYKQSYYMTLIFNGLLALGCAVLAAYIVFHKHDPVPVQKVSEEEYQAVVQLERQAQAEKATLLRRIEDLSAIRRNLSAQLRTQNANNTKLIKQLEELHAIVPAQPIILKEIYKEAATEKGLRQVVDRAFGNGMGARIKVVNE